MGYRKELLALQVINKVAQVTLLTKRLFLIYYLEKYTI